MQGLAALLRDKRTMVLLSWNNNGRLAYHFADVAGLCSSAGTLKSPVEIERAAERHREASEQAPIR